MTISSEDREFVRNRAPKTLCLACIRCNLKKGPNIASVDPQTKRSVALYHPRTQRWEEHFQLIDGRILGLTAEGRATVALLDANDEGRVRIRNALIGRGWLP